MRKFSSALCGIALIAATAGPPVLAASSASSAVSESVGASSAGISASLKTSSNSSNTRDVAQGDYRIVDIAAAEGRAGQLRLTLQRERATDEAASANDTLFLTLPAPAFEASGLARGARVAATHRSYGIEFARATDKAPFFLVLEDHWLQELASRPVVL